MPRPLLERLPYFRFHSADYLIDTVGLTQAQHGAYLLLLIHYYWEGFLPTEQSALYSLACAVDDVGKAAVDVVVSRYLHREDDGTLIHNRVERELLHLGELMQQRSKAGLRSAAVRAAKAVLSPKTDKKPLHQGNGADSGFPEFWLSYPRREAKADALKAWTKLHPDEALQGRILRALSAQKSNGQWHNIKYVPYAATWLNARRWEDELSTATSTRKVAL